MVEKKEYCIHKKRGTRHEPEEEESVLEETEIVMSNFYPEEMLDDVADNEIFRRDAKECVL
jgi:hypothetical protein